MSSASALVLGGGILGSSAAYALARDGFEVTLVDAADAGAATAAGAGIVAPATSLGLPEEWYRLAFAAAGFYPRLVERLSEEGVREVGYDVPGLLFLALDEHDRERLGQVEREIEQRRAAGAPGIGQVSRLQDDELRRLFPPLAVGGSALHLSAAARVDGRMVRSALQEGLRRRGGTIVRGRASLVASAGRWSVKVERSAALDADLVVCATGAWTDAWADGAGPPPPVRPQRGQILHLQLPGTPTGEWPMIVGFGSHYMLTFPQERVVAGATREDAAGWEHRVTLAGLAELVREALRVAPGLADATVVETRIGFRPVSRDGLPVIGRAPGIENGVIATGLGASGLTLGPYVGVLAAELAAGREPALDLGWVAPERFCGR